jgi:hypothetical protein
MRGFGICLRATVALVSAVWCVNAAAQDESRQALIGSLDFSSDTEGFDALRARAGGLYSYANPWSLTGLEAQSTRYQQKDFHAEVYGVLGLYRNQRRDTLAGIDIEAGVARVSGRLRPIGEASWRLTPTAASSVALTASADLVETAPALESGIGSTFITVSGEQQFAERFTATGLAGWQDFTDRNSRTHLRASLIWLAVPAAGMTMQVRYRQYASSEADVSGAYFNPNRYRQWLGVVAIRKRHAGWILSGALGAGQEHLIGADSHSSYLAEFRADGPIIGAARLLVRAGYYRSAGFIDSPDYAYQVASATVVVPLR